MNLEEYQSDHCASSSERLDSGQSVSARVLPQTAVAPRVRAGLSQTAPESGTPAPTDASLAQAPLLEVANLTFAYHAELSSGSQPGTTQGPQRQSRRHKTQPVFSDLSFTARRGDIIVLLGPNGSGKTTLLNCIAQLLRPQAGQVCIAGRELRGLGPRELARELGYLPQVQITLPEFTVQDYVVMGRAPFLRYWQNPSTSDYSQAHQVLEDLGVAHLKDLPCNQISGGERQLVQIARILVQGAPLILMDEPTNHLDYGNQIRALRLIQKLAAQGFAIIMTSHVPDHAIWLDGLVGTIRPGCPFDFGTAKQMLDEQRLSELYQENISLHYLADRGHCICVPELKLSNECQCKTSEMEEGNEP